MIVLLVIAAALVAAGGATSGAPPVGSSLYVVQPDPRLCPSPLCGGHWVALANHARTRCHDGALRPRCYVARTVAEERHQQAVDVPAGALVRAEIEPWEYEGFGMLGTLVVADVFSPAGRAPPKGSFFRLADTGVRCIRAPCFSVRASRVNRPSRTTVSGIDIGAARATPDELVRIEAALGTKSGVRAQGRIVSVPDGGRNFLATRFFLRSVR